MGFTDRARTQRKTEKTHYLSRAGAGRERACSRRLDTVERPHHADPCLHLVEERGPREPAPISQPLTSRQISRWAIFGLHPRDTVALWNEGKKDLALERRIEGT